jgi:general nucleoside transport system permease protein
MISSVLSALFDVLTSEAAYINALTFAVFLAFGANGEWVAEKSGTLNISLEAMFLAGAFAAALGFDRSGGNQVVALICGMTAGLTVALVQAQMSHRLVANQFVVGLTLNILVLGVASFLASEFKPVTRKSGTVPIPVLSDIPLIGTALFDRAWLFYLIYPLVPLCWWLVFRTRWGLELRSAGENPQSADVSGIDVNKRRRQGIYVAGLTAGMGGTYLVLAAVGQFENSIVGGRGFIALIAVIFGGWTLRGTIAGCLLFGSVLSFRLSLPALGYQVNGDLLASLPFIVTIAVMAIFATRVRPPHALAQPFIRGLK